MNKREKLLWDILIVLSLLTIGYIYYYMFVGSDSYYFQSKNFKNVLENKIANKDSVNDTFEKKVILLNDILEMRSFKKVIYVTNPMNPGKINRSDAGGNSANIKRGILCTMSFTDSNNEIEAICEHNNTYKRIKLGDSINNGTVIELTKQYIIIQFEEGYEIKFEFGK